MSAMSASMSAIASDMADISARLVQLEEQVSTRTSRRQRPTPRPTPMADTGYDPARAMARMQALRAEGRSLAQIAHALNAERIPTRHGKPWQKGTVGYLLQGTGG